MSEFAVFAALSAAVAGLITNLLVPFVVKIALAIRAVDYPGGRKVQAAAVPRLGGVAIVLGLALAAGGLFLAQWGQWGQIASRGEFLALVVAAAMVFLVGLVDDIVGVSSAKKFLVELVAAALMVRVGWSFEVLRLPGLGTIELGVAGSLVSLLWIVGVTNAINLLDGLDGLAGGVVAIISGSLLIYSVILGNQGTVILMGATVGASLGFLRHNWAPARIFMGDSGSLTLGFLLAAASVHSALKAPAAVAILVPILALGVPVIDTLLVMALRFLARPKGRVTNRFLSMFHADRNHLHHLLAHFGGSRTRIVTVIYAVVLASCAMALLVATRGDTALGVVLIVLEFAVVLGIRQLGMAAQAGNLALEQREQVKRQLGGPEPAAVEPPVVLRFPR